MMFLRPLKAQKALRLILENVARYRSGKASYASFFYRANRLWTIVQRSSFHNTVDRAYLELMEAK